MENDSKHKQVDIGGYKTAAGAAKRTAKALREIASELGQSPDEVAIHNPEETRHYRNMSGDADVWTVSWEGGPFEWASWLTGGESLFAGEFGRTGMDPEIVGFFDSSGFSVECYYSFDIQFYND